MAGKKGKDKEKKSKNEDKTAIEGNRQIEQQSLQEAVTCEPKLLTEDAIYYRYPWEEKPTASVPPPTPSSDFGFEYTFKPLPDELPSAVNLKVPLVREKGVKICIELLADYFGCKDYNFNLFQFWFLDVLTDCLWKVQDEFGFPDHLQKVVLEWILYIFDVIRGPGINFSRKKVNRLFKEAIILAAEVTEEGCPELPPPRKLFEFIAENEEDESSESDSSDSESSSISSIASDDGAESYVQLNLKDQPNCFALNKELCKCNSYELMSSEGSSETSIVEMPPEDEEQVSSSGDMDIEFYKSDHDIPARFLPLPEEESLHENSKEGSESHISKCTTDSSNGGVVENVENSVEDEETQHKYLVESVSGEFSVRTDSDCLLQSEPPSSCEQYADPITPQIKSVINSPQITPEANKESKMMLRDSPKSKSSSILKKVESRKSQKSINNLVIVEDERPEKVREKEVMSKLKEFKLWEKRIQDMADPRVGWLPGFESVEEQEPTKPTDDLSDEREWVDIIEQQVDEITNTDQNKILNFASIWAIIDFVFEYFYESFQFTLIKLAFQACPNIISQFVNDDWKVPKLPKGELKKPPVKKKKPTKEKKPKKDKSSKGSKKDKKSKKGKKDKSKASKKDKKSKSKGSKDGKKSKKSKEKPKKLTKEEKEQLEKERREQAELEAERIRQEENKRFMFPLTDAATDDLFKGIFENWVKVDINAKGGKKGKDKKGKKKK